MTNGILCATDFSDSSKEALKWSIELAQKLTCPLFILYTYRLIKTDGKIIPIRKEIEESALKKFESLENELLTGTDINYGFTSEVGFVNDRITEHVKKNKLSFLVIGKDMGLGNQEAFDELINHLQIPLVIIP